MGIDDLVKHGSVEANKWCSWVLLDLPERMIVSVTWRAMSSGVERTAMICVMCRMDVSRPCRDEVICEMESALCVREQDVGGNGKSSDHVDSGSD